MDEKLAANRVQPLGDDARCAAVRLMPAAAKCSDEAKAATIVSDGHHDVPLFTFKLDVRASGAAVAPNVSERFLHDSDELATHERRQVHLGQGRREVGRDAGLATETLNDAPQ